MKKTALSIALSLALATPLFAGTKQDYTAKIMSGEIDPTVTSFDQFKRMNANKGPDLKKMYTAKIRSGEIDPTVTSFAQFKKMNAGSGQADPKKEYTAKIMSGEIDPTTMSFDQYKASLGGSVSTNVSQGESGKVLVSQSDVTTHNNDVKSTPQTTDDVEKSIKSFLKRKGYRTGLNNRGKHKGTGKYIVYHIQTVTKDKNDKRFRDSVSNAYEKAYFGAQKKLAMQLYGKNMSDKAMSLFENNSDNVDERFRTELESAKNAKEKVNTIFGKIKKLTHAKLDSALKKEGVSEAQLKSLSVSKKQTLYKDSFVKNISEGFSTKELIGSTPIQTYLGMYNGAPAVGVIMMKSDKTSIVASDIANKRKPRITKSKGKDPMSLLPKDDKGYLKEFGVRLFYDENGFPGVISYAQKGVSSRSDKASRIAKAISSSKRTAEMRANSQISEFIGVVMSANDTTSQGEKEETILKNRLNKVSGEEEIAEITTDSIIDIMNQTAEANSEMDLPGTSELYNWQHKDELGNMVVGVVSLWSYDQLAAAQRVISGKDINYGTSEREKKAMKEVFIQTQGGRDVMEVDDF